ncbi:GntR family transcriptional regulator [Comamonas sp. BIGb0124]|uniref:GntR family transcriptional regulator n=1 Tax=Comamonas sp. BIGb0124 TaxID=2485130 RepID=UPI000F9721C5|nr:GntR family transcriptional regulator [Comamonas sp. BIGb0124]ROR18553.1 GntR family transcriptional regulator [Comamonas sp. BIGb0124]
MPRSTSDVYSILRRRIILGEFLPGTQLKEAALALELNVSRTPVRHAFKSLLDDGLVSAEPNRGVFVAPWADQDNDEVFDLRIMVESHAAGLAAERRQPEHLAKLQGLNAEMSRLIEDRPDGYLDGIQTCNRNFHWAILQASGSPRLMKFAESLLTVHRVIGAFYYYTPEQLQSSLHDHVSITGAIERGNAKLARALVEAHIGETWQRLKESRLSLPASEDAAEASGVLSHLAKVT